MKTITLHQPWTSLITEGFKRYETRSWSTPYRGLLAIHAGKKWDDELRDIAGDLAERFPELSKYIQHTPPLGAVLGICRLVHCCETKAVRNGLSKLERAVGDYGDGRFAWKLQLLEVFETPIPAAGAQKLWDWTPPQGFFDNRVAIVGSRKFPDVVTVYEYVDKLPKDTIVISGGAKGVDEAVEYAARQCGLKVISIPVSGDEWKVVGNGAGHIRNQSIIDMAGRVVAFHENSSPGTANTIQKTKAAGKHLIVNPHKRDSPSEEMIPNTSHRYSRDAVMPIAQKMAGMLKIACDQLYIAGSLRRGKPDVKDAELVAVPKIIDGQNALWWLLEKLLEEGSIQKAPYGETGTTRWGEKYRGLLYKDLKIEIFSSLPNALGYQYWLRTGPGDSNMLLMKLLKSKAAPFRVEDGQVWWNDVALNIPDEKAWFKLLGIPPIAPGQRTKVSLQDAFDGQWKGWGNPEEFMQKAHQLTLGGDFNMHDEGALIAYLEKKEKLKPHSSKRDEQPFEWSAPWMHPDGQRVFVFNGWEAGKRKYALAPVNSERAKAHARTIGGCTYMSETEALLEWWVTQDKTTISVSKQVYDGYVSPVVYEFPEKAPIETISVDDLLYTMPDVYQSWVWWYERNSSDVDSNGDLPMVARFACGRMLLLDGHHRCEARVRLGRKTLRAKVNMVPMTFDEATALDEDDGSADLALFADILEEVYEILKEAKELEYA
jgi:hypothetical protein